MEMREKVLTFLTHKSKPRVLQTTLVLVKVLSGQYHSYPLTQFNWTGKSLCKYYISMILYKIAIKIDVFILDNENIRQTNV